MRGPMCQSPRLSNILKPNNNQLFGTHNNPKRSVDENKSISHNKEIIISLFKHNKLEKIVT